MKTLILAEKPDQAMKYCVALDRTKTEAGLKKTEQRNGFVDLGQTEISLQTVVTWGYGHLVTLFEPNDYDKNYKKWENRPMPLFPEKIQYKLTDSAGKQFKLIKKLLKEADQIIIATDPDREGEAIAHLIMEKSELDFSKKEIKRLWVNNQDYDDLLNGFKNLKDAKDYEGFSVEAKTRAISDWLVGMNLSVFYTQTLRKLGIKGTFRTGRVQTPILYLVYAREKEISLFKPKAFYTIELLGELEGKPVSFKKSEKFESQELLSSYLKENKIKKSQKVKIKSVNKEEKQDLAPPLLTLSDLQGKASDKYDYDFDKTMEIQQSLYSKGKTTYPRTSCEFITTAELDYLTKYKEDYKTFLGLEVDLNNIPGKKHVNDKKVLEHFAIIPTKKVPTAGELTEEEMNVYKIIVEHTLLMFMEPYQYEQTKAIVCLNDQEFTTTGKVMKNLGWKKVANQAKKSSETDKELPMLEIDQEVELETKINEGKTQAPSLFTDKTLSGKGGALENIQKFVEDKEKGKILKETKGLGTPATRTEILSKLVEHGYLERKGKQKQLVTTNLGKGLCIAVEGSFLANPVTTADWEEHLENVGLNKISSETFIKNIKRTIEEEIKNFPKRVEPKKEVIKKLIPNKLGI